MSVSSGGLQNVAWDPNPLFSAPPALLSPHHEATTWCYEWISSSQSKIKHRVSAGDLPGNPPHNRPSRWRCRTLSLAASALKRKAINEIYVLKYNLANMLLQIHYMESMWTPLLCTWPGRLNVRQTILSEHHCTTSLKASSHQHLKRKYFTATSINSIGINGQSKSPQILGGLWPESLSYWPTATRLDNAHQGDGELESQK